jgi:hypothetical protein
VKTHYVPRFEEEPYRKGEFRERRLYRSLPGGLWKLLERTAGWHLVGMGVKP